MTKRQIVVRLGKPGTVSRFDGVTILDHDPGTFAPTAVHTVIQIEHLLNQVREDESHRDETEDDEHRRGSERKNEDVRAREDRAMSGDPDGRLGGLDDVLEAQDYPITTDELVAVTGDYEIETQDGTESLEDVLASTDNQSYDSADDVRSRILGLIHR